MIEQRNLQCQFEWTLALENPRHEPIIHRTIFTSEILSDSCIRFAVLGRFLHSLNKYCEEEFHTQYDISDYKQYDFASVSYFDTTSWKSHL